MPTLCQALEKHPKSKTEKGSCPSEVYSDVKCTEVQVKNEIFQALNVFINPGFKEIDIVKCFF